MSFHYIRKMGDSDLNKQYFLEHLFEMVLRRVAVDKMSKFLDIVNSIKTKPDYYDEEDRCYIYQDISINIAHILTNKVFKYIREDNELHYYINEDMMRDIKIKFYLDL